MFASVHIAYHVVSELLKHPDALGTESAATVANGLLNRLRNALASYPEFLRATDDLKTADVKAKKGQAVEAERAFQVEVLLAVLSGVCEAFIVGFGQTDRGKFGFDLGRDE